MGWNRVLMLAAVSLGACLLASCVGLSGTVKDSPGLAVAGAGYRVVEATGIPEAMAKDAAKKRKSEFAMGELRIGEPPPGGAEAWVAAKAEYVRLVAGKSGQAELKFRDSHNCLPWFTGARLQDGKVIQLRTNCLHECGVVGGQLKCGPIFARGNPRPFD